MEMKEHDQRWSDAAAAARRSVLSTPSDRQSLPAMRSLHLPYSFDLRRINCLTNKIESTT